MELIPLGSVSLGVWIVGLAWPLHSVPQTFHDGHNFNGLDIEVILWDPGTVYM